MADLRITGLTTTATAPAADDFIELDGATNGSRRMSAKAGESLPNARSLGGIYLDGQSSMAGIADSAVLATYKDPFGAWLCCALDSLAADRVLIDKVASNLGFRLSWIQSTGKLRLQLGNGTSLTTYSYDSTAAVATISDLARDTHVAFFTDRSSLYFFVNGVQLGTTVDVSGSGHDFVDVAVLNHPVPDVKVILDDGVDVTVNHIG